MKNRLPVLFVHGYPLDQRMWRHQQELAPEYDVHAFDLPGFGRSSIGSFTTPRAPASPPTAPPPPTALPRATSPAAIASPRAATSPSAPPAISQGPPASLGLYAGTVLKELETCGIDRAVLVGFSMGGYILFECLRRFPQRIAALVLADTRAEADPPEGAAKRYAAIEQVRRGEIAPYLSTLYAALVAPARRGDPALRAEVLAMMQDADPEGLVHALAAMAERPDSRALLPAIEVPTLVIAGADDALIPSPVAQAMAEAIPGAVLQMIPGAGHLAPLERPAEFNERLRRFLRTVPATS